MNRPSPLNWLVPVIIFLAVITSGAGLFVGGGEGRYQFVNPRGVSVEMYGEGLYRYDSLMAGAGFRGTDAVTLFISIPLLLVSYILSRRGSYKFHIILLGVLYYFLYNGASMTFSAGFNPLFLVYTALFSTSLFAVIVGLTTFDLEGLAKRILPGFPRRRIAVFNIAIGIITFLLWMSEIIPSLMTGKAPENLGPYTTMFTHGFDSAVITPAAVLAGIFILQRKPLGYLLAAPTMILCALVGAVVIGQTISQALEGIVFPVGVYIGLVGSWIIMGGFAIWLTIGYFRHLDG